MMSTVPAGITSFVHWDILRALFEAARTFTSVEVLAAYVGREPEVVRQEVRVLVARGLVEAVEWHGGVVYALPADGERRQQVEDFLIACRDESVALAVVAALTRRAQEREQMDE